MLAVDLVAHRKAHVVAVREAAVWSAVWVSLGVAFGGLIWAVYGGELGAQYFAGYLIEKSLAVDNVFVFAIIFSYFAVPREYQHRVLFYGVLGALVFRGGLHRRRLGPDRQLRLDPLPLRRVPRAHRHPDGPRTATSTWTLGAAGCCGCSAGWCRPRDELHGQRFWVRRDGRLVATPLLAVLVLVEVTDIVFAVDSIPAIFAVTQEPFLVFTSNAFAILGLRAMYFLLADLIHRFVYLKLGLALVLVWVGVKMLLLEVYKIPTLASLAVVAAIITVAVVLSLRATRVRRPSRCSRTRTPPLPGPHTARPQSTPARPHPPLRAPARRPT